jgi:hypothetical protein
MKIINGSCQTQLLDPEYTQSPILESTDSLKGTCKA